MVRMVAGRLFHMSGPATEKARLPNCVLTFLALLRCPGFLAMRCVLAMCSLPSEDTAVVVLIAPSQQPFKDLGLGLLTLLLHYFSLYLHFCYFLPVVL